MNSENRREVYLPEGEWVDFFTGEAYTGKQWLTLENIPLETMPVYVKKGASVPFYPAIVQCTDEMDLTQTIQIEIDPAFQGIFNKTDY